MKFTLTNKEELKNFFPNNREVLSEINLIKERFRRLIQAMFLGNRYKHKTRLVIEDMDAKVIAVETTIWAVTDNHIILKGGVVLPINCVREVQT